MLFLIQLQNTLMNGFDKTFPLAFYNSFVKIELSCDKKNMIISNT